MHLREGQRVQIVFSNQIAVIEPWANPANRASYTLHQTSACSRDQVVKVLEDMASEQGLVAVPESECSRWSVLKRRK